MAFDHGLAGIVEALRQKIEADPERPAYILTETETETETETGIGYRLRAPE